jgi:hypothetical protein
MRRVGRLRKRARWVWCKLNAIPKTVRIVVIAATIVAVFSAMNLVYQVLRKPTEVFAPVSGEFNKTPIETWRQYAPLFREYSTASISPELLAALARALEDRARLSEIQDLLLSVLLSAKRQLNEVRTDVRKYLRTKSRSSNGKRRTSENG